MFIQLDEQGQPQDWPLTDTAVMALHRETSFPLPLSRDGYPDLGVHPLSEGVIPDVNRYQRVEEATPVFVDGAWTRQWTVIEFSEAEKQTVDDSQSRNVREERTRRLAYCDWTQLPDAPVDPAPWATYRQALRDITAQAGFPWDVTWPEPPAAA